MAGGSTVVMAPAMRTTTPTSPRTSSSSAGNLSRSLSEPQYLSMPHFSKYQERAYDDSAGSRHRRPESNFDLTFDNSFKLDTSFSLPSAPGTDREVELTSSPLTLSGQPPLSPSNPIEFVNVNRAKREQSLTRHQSPSPSGSISSSNKTNTKNNINSRSNSNSSGSISSSSDSGISTPHWRPSGRDLAQEERVRLEDQAVRRSRAGSLMESGSKPWLQNNSTVKGPEKGEFAPPPRARSWFPGIDGPSRPNPPPKDSQTTQRPYSSLPTSQHPSPLSSQPQPPARESNRPHSSLPSSQHPSPLSSQPPTPAPPAQAQTQAAPPAQPPSLTRPVTTIGTMGVGRSSSSGLEKPYLASSERDTSAPQQRPAPAPETRRYTTQDGLASLAKRSWLPSSGDQSAKNRTSAAEALPIREDTDGKGTRRSIERSRTELPSESKPTPSRPSPEPSMASKSFTRASTYFNKIKSKQPISIKKLTNGGDSGTPSTTSERNISDPVPDRNVPSAGAASTSTPPISLDTSFPWKPETNGTTTPTPASAAVTPTLTATDASATGQKPPPLPRQSSDPLWAAFKNLEIEHKTFSSKSTPQRVAQVQSILSPCLRSSMDHPSTKQLAAEDIERRTLILAKWWHSILESLEGTGMGSIPSMDRHVMFDALMDIASRPEWRQTTSHFLPLAERSPSERVRTRSWTLASQSTNDPDEDFIQESAQHNVRTTFITNLAKQLAFVVEKMGMRNVPPALASFAAKTCAYAFFFVPGVADALVRLWNLGPELLRRTADVLGLPRASKGEQEDIVALFPPKLAGFGWTTSRNMWTRLKQVPKMPIMISRIDWTGPWVSRWKGAETDLLFIFFKQFHILADDFMPSGLPLTEKARAPGFVLVHAQLLSIVDDTIHLAQTGNFGPAIVDPMPGADASAMAMPLPPPNLMKGMSENSLVMLMKEMRSDESAEFRGARTTVLAACTSLIKAGVMRTSQFDTAACFTLCDFLEEVLVDYASYRDPVNGRKMTDWDFWIDVFQRIFASHNTMSEVRVLAFVYSIWDTVTESPERKATICLNWLLTEETFNTFFNHWCPMVRAYYQRLLCWRICRSVEDADEVDLNILTVVAARLKTTWSHYLYLKQAAEEAGRCPPSTAPMFPTPGKKFMIIRQEVNQPQPGLFVNFDSLAKTPGADIISGEDFVENPMAPRMENSKKKKSLLGKVLSSIAGGGSGAPGSQNSKMSWDEEFVNTRRETAEARTSKSIESHTDSPTGPGTPESGRSSLGNDEQNFVFRFFLAWHQPASPPRDRTLVRPRLPNPAQNLVNARPRDGEAAKSSSSPSDVGGGEADDVSVRPSACLVNMPLVAASVKQAKEILADSITHPVKPTGICARNAAYTGRALSEWFQVTWECNTFAEKRREDGMTKLSDIEVPMLGVESFRKPVG